MVRREKAFGVAQRFISAGLKVSFESERRLMVDDTVVEIVTELPQVEGRYCSIMCGAIHQHLGDTGIGAWFSNQLTRMCPHLVINAVASWDRTDRALGCAFEKLGRYLYEIEPHAVRMHHSVLVYITSRNESWLSLLRKDPVFALLSAGLRGMFGDHSYYTPGNLDRVISWFDSRGLQFDLKCAQNAVYEMGCIKAD
jgi:hypothetical protein